MLLAQGSSQIDPTVAAAAIGVVGALGGAALAAWSNRRTQLTTLEAERSAQQDARHAERKAQREAREAAEFVELQSLLADGLSATDHVIADTKLVAADWDEEFRHPHQREIAEHWKDARRALLSAALRHPNADLGERVRRLAVATDGLVVNYRLYLLRARDLNAVVEARDESIKLVKEIGRITSS